jgi:Protein of unknown function (DUF1190)
MGMIIIEDQRQNRCIAVPARDEESEVDLPSVRRANRREWMPISGTFTGLAALAVIVAALVQPGDAAARTRRHQARAAPLSAVYTDERNCVAKNALAQTQCHNAAFNSHAEYEEKAPRFEANGDCVRIFGARNCSMRIGGGPKGIGFIPTYEGFTLVRAKDGEETLVLPVLAGKSATVEFTPRPVSSLDTEQDAQRSAQAQAAWQNAHSPTIRSAGGALRYREAPKDTMPDPSGDSGEAQPGPAATYPVSPAMLKSMQEEMRKYGNPQPAQAAAPSK